MARPCRTVTADVCKDASDVTVSETAIPIPAPMGEMMENVAMKAMLRIVLMPFDEKKMIASILQGVLYEI